MHTSWNVIFVKSFANPVWVNLAVHIASVPLPNEDFGKNDKR